MTITGVMRTGEVVIKVVDIDAAREHYGERVGLIETLRDENGTTYYKAWDEHDLYSIVIRPSDSPGIGHVAFKTVDDAALTEVTDKLHELGIETTDLPAESMPRSGRRVRFILPTGHEAHLYAEKEQCGNGMPLHNPGTMPPPGTVRGMRVTRLDHCLLGGQDIDGNTAIFRDAFGWNLSEKLIDHESEMTLVMFWTGSNKPHDIAFVRQPEDNRFHHASFLLESVNDVYHAADLMGYYDIPVEVGPTRHGITRGATIYFFDPSGNRNEVFTDGYLHYPDSPTLVWDTSKLGQAIFSQDNTPRQSFLEVLT
jgi:catechol 2,3-dioxygenase